MSMFGKSRQDALEEAFMKHMDKEEAAFQHVIESLDSIKNEMHNTNAQITELSASQELKLLELKSEILKLLFDKMVEKHVYESGLKFIEQRRKDDIARIDKTLESKIDRKTGHLIWIGLTSIGAVGTVILKFFH